MSEFTFVSNNLEDTESFATAIGRSLRGREVLELISDLGGGKTTLVKGLAKGLDITDTVQSPTFTISRIYNARDELELHHFDFYRLSEAGVVADELAESLQQPNAITVIEWGEIVHNVLPEHRITVRIANLGETQRKITVTTPAGDEYIHDAMVQFSEARNLA